jgi:hypothetical protein
MIETPADIYQCTRLLLSTLDGAGVSLYTTRAPNRTDAIDWAVRRAERERWRMTHETGRQIWSVTIFNEGEVYRQSFGRSFGLDCNLCEPRQ